MDFQLLEEALTRLKYLCSARSDGLQLHPQVEQNLREKDRLDEVARLQFQPVIRQGDDDKVVQAGYRIEARIKALREALKEEMKQCFSDGVNGRNSNYVHYDWNGYCDKCLASRQLGDFDSADRIIEEGLSVHGEVKELLMAYGDNAMDQQRWPEALKRWQRMIRTYPKDSYAYRRAVEASNNIEPDPITWQLLKALSSKTQKKRRICIVQWSGFSGHAKYLYLFLLRRISCHRVDICWVTGSFDVYHMLTASNLPVMLWDQAPAKSDYLLQTDLSVYTSHEQIPLFGGTLQACLSSSTKVQLWHGIPAKLVGYRSFLEWEDINKFARYAFDVSGYDHVIVESDNIMESYRLAFPFSRICAKGGCRTDILLGSQLFDENEVWLGSKQLPPNANDKKIALYAPTYRESSQDLGLFIKAFEELIEYAEHNDSFTLAVKPHPGFVSETKVDLKPFTLGKNNTLFINPLEDIYPWAARAAYLITDYSSVYYDFLITKKPIVLFRPDEALYSLSRTRFQYSFETDTELGPVVGNAADIGRALLEAKGEEWYSKRAALAAEFHALPHDGIATERVADLIISLLRVL